MARVIVYHRGYGCDTGCCGHTVEIYADETVTRAGDDFDPYMYDSESRDDERNFQFAHPYNEDEPFRFEWAKQLVVDTYGEEHVKDLDWEHCFVTGDC